MDIDLCIYIVIHKVSELQIRIETNEYDRHGRKKSFWTEIKSTWRYIYIYIYIYLTIIH